jgi:hypothetical protein
MVVAFGGNQFGECAIPALPPGIRYIVASAAYGRTVLLRSDGVIVSLGLNQGRVPPAPPGLSYVSVAAGNNPSLGLLSDGSIVEWGYQGTGAVPRPPLPWGVNYVEIAAGRNHRAARRSDGTVVTWGLMQNGEQWVPQLAPGTSFVQLSVHEWQGAVRIGPTCTYVSFAPGCAGSVSAARLVPRDTPRIGQVHEVTLFDLPASVACMIFGWSRTAPANLGQYGLPGCSLHTSLDAVVFLAGSNGQAKLILPIPNAPGLVGLRFYNQAMVLDPAAGNPLGAVMSDAAEGVIGHW